MTSHALLLRLTSIFASLNRGAIRASHLCCLGSFGALDDDKLDGLSVSHTAKVLPGVVLDDGSL